MLQMQPYQERTTPAEPFPLFDVRQIENALMSARPGPLLLLLGLPRSWKHGHGG